MARMRCAALAFPAVLAEIIQDAQILDDAVAQRDIELQEIAFLAQPGVAEKIARIVAREQIFTGGNGDAALRGDIAGEIEIERMHRLLDPGEGIGLQRLEILDRLAAIEGAIAIDRKAHASFEHTKHRIDPFEVGGEARAADLDLEAAMPLVDGAAYIVAETFNIVCWTVVTTTGVNSDLAARATAIAFRK